VGRGLHRVSKLSRTDTTYVSMALASNPPGCHFTACRYLYVNRMDFRSDLEEMRVQMDLGGHLAPKWKKVLGAHKTWKILGGPNKFSQLTRQATHSTRIMVSYSFDDTQTRGGGSVPRFKGKER
jgi:hypothetical protein